MKGTQSNVPPNPTTNNNSDNNATCIYISWSCKHDYRKKEVMSRIILDLCGGTGSWSKPFKDNGYDVRVMTLPDFNVEESL